MASLYALIHSGLGNARLMMLLLCRASIVQDVVVPELLRSREREVDVDMLDLRELQEPVRTELTSDAGLLVPPERGEGVDEVKVIDPHGAGSDPLGNADRLRDIAREHGAAKAVDAV